MSFKKNGLVPDIDFSEKGWAFQFGTTKPKCGNDIVINPDTTPRFCYYDVLGYVICKATGKRIDVEPSSRWIYTTIGRKSEKMFSSDYY